jgi:magnesium-transporting ATPase (P-type)
MAKRRAVVKKIHSVEALGTVSVICSDKTGATRLLPCSVCQLKLVDPGTLTRNELTVTEFQVLRASRLASIPSTMT